MSYSAGTIPVADIKTDNATSSGESIIRLTSTGEWQLLAGDYINIGGDTKVYEVAADTNLIVGAQDVQLTFPLRVDISDESIITANNVKWTLVSNGEIETSMVASDNQEIELTLVAVEKL